MSFLGRHRSSAASHCDRLSYIHGPDQVYSSEYISTFDARKNLNDLFQSICEEDVCMENLRVYLRVRPSLPGEVQQDEDTKVDLLDDRSVVLTAPACSNTFKNSVRGITKLSHKFTFTHIYGPSTTQEELFKSSAHTLVTDFLSGQNCLLFTYGATNSGKTFTVQGTAGDAGLLPRTLQHIFTTVGEHQYPRNDLKPKFSFNVTRLEEQDVLKEEGKRESIFKITSNLTTTFSQSTMSLLKSSICEESLKSTEQLSECSTVSHNTTEAGDMDARNTTTISSRDSASPGSAIYAVFVSFAEIYNEYIFDLLEKMPSSKGNKRNTLMLGEDRNGAIYIKGLNEVRVRTSDEALQLLNIGRQNLHFAATRLNHNSSRSHCIFTIKLVRLADANCPQFARVSVLSLCDLAGAERAAKTHSTQDRLKESGNINTSLLTLSRCIEALRFNQTQKSSKKVPVPYRDSKLTRLFQSFLLGRGKAAMIVNISKMPLLFDETLQVLKFSAIAKQVVISQTRESEVALVQPPRRVSRLSKMVRQSFKGNGRLSVPWSKAAASVTFGESVCEEKEGEEEDLEKDLIEEEEEEDEAEVLLQQIAKLKDELIRERREKQDMEERMRRELCKEFSQQLVEIQNSWSQRLRDQESRYEEYTECKIQALMSSMKECNKRMRTDEDPDEEYVPSIFLFREQRKVEDQNLQIKELEADGKLLEEEVKALKESQRKTNEIATKVQEENSRLTFKLAQLTCSYDKVVQELKEAQLLNIAASTDNTEAVKELRTQLETRSAQLAEQNKEIQELQTMLLEASECYTNKEKECAAFEKTLESSQIANTQQMMHINELESQLEGARSMLSQQAAQVEEREQDIDDLRQLASQERKTNKEELEKMKTELKTMEEDHIREKSKLLLEMAGLKRNRPLEGSGNAEELKILEEKVSQLQEEKGTLKESEEALKKNWQQETAEKDEQIKSLQKMLTVFEKKLSKKEEIDLTDENEKEAKMEELEKKLKDAVSCQLALAAEKEAEINSLKENTDTLSSQLQNLKVSKESLNTQLEETMCSLKEKEDAESVLQKDLEGCKAKLEELQKAHRSLKEIKEEEETTLQENCNAYKVELDELQKAHTSLKEEAEQTEAKLQESLRACKDELQELQKAQMSLKENDQENEKKLQESLCACKTELEELQKAHTSLKEKEKEKEAELQESMNVYKTELQESMNVYKTELQESMNVCKGELKELQEAKASLEKENEFLQTKLQHQINMLDEVKSEAEAKIKEKDEHAANHSSLCEKLRAEVDEMKKLKDGLEDTVKELSELRDINVKLETQVEQIKEEKSEILARVDMLEVDKKKMGERLYNLQEANLLKAQHAETEMQSLEEQNEILTKEKEELEAKVKASHKLSQEQTSLVKDKQEVILSLSSKIESLDAKLNAADMNVTAKNQLEEELSDARENIIRLETKCDLHEKEIRALREARQAEVQESFNRTREHEDFARQKEMEISTLQQEVKKLLQQSLTSSRGSISETPSATTIKAEVSEGNDALQVMKEQLRLTVAHNSTLMQEVSTLRTQVARQSTTSDTSVLQLSASKSSLKKQRDASTSDMECITPVPKDGGRGRKTRQAKQTPDINSQRDSSVGEARKSHQVSPPPSWPHPAPSSSSGRPQRSTRRTMRYDSYEYELTHKPNQDEEDTLEPSPSTTKGARRTTRGRKKSKVSETTKPHLQDQENKSSMANKADIIPEVEVEHASQPKNSKKKASSSRGRRVLFDPEDVQEPFLCTPDKVPEVVPEDSPLTMVRRQLRTKRK